MREADPSLRRLERDALIWTALATVAALVVRPDQPGLAAGVTGGGLLALASLWAIRSGVDALLARLVPAPDAPVAGPPTGDAVPPRAGAGLVVKLAGRYALLGLGAYVMIVRLRLHAIGVLIGASSLVAAASFEAVRVLRRS
jgi:hypothetical protein